MRPRPGTPLPLRGSGRRSPPPAQHERPVHARPAEFPSHPLPTARPSPGAHHRSPGPRSRWAGRPAGWGIRYQCSEPIGANNFSREVAEAEAVARGDDVSRRALPLGPARRREVRRCPREGSRDRARRVGWRPAVLAGTRDWGTELGVLGRRVSGLHSCGARAHEVLRPPAEWSAFSAYIQVTGINICSEPASTEQYLP